MEKTEIINRILEYEPKYKDAVSKLYAKSNVALRTILKKLEVKSNGIRFRLNEYTMKYILTEGFYVWEKYYEPSHYARDEHREIYFNDKELLFFDHGTYTPFKFSDYGKTWAIHKEELPRHFKVSCM